MDEAKQVTVAHVLKGATNHLEKAGIASPRLASELLLSRLLGCPRLELYLRHDAPLSEKQLEAMRRGTRRVAAHEPIQYITGQSEFMGLVFKSDARALIPRPETEVLVRCVLETESVWARTEEAPDHPPLIVDIGTGSGCICIALAHARSDAAYVAVDISPEALALARENAEALDVADRIVFAQGDLSDALEPESVSAIVANLPYIPTDAYLQLPPDIRDHEPRLALDGGSKGLDIITEVIADSAVLLRRGGWIFLETSEDQPTHVVELLEAEGFTDIDVRRDLTDRDRVVLARMP